VLGTRQSRFWRVAATGLILGTLIAPSVLAAREQPTLEELKNRVDKVSVEDRPPLCIRVSELQLSAVDKLYVAGDNEKMHAALGDVVTYSEMARDYSIQSQKHEKQSEIAIRKMARKLGDLKHTVSREDQEQIQNTIDRLQRIRDDLLAAMFTKGGKE
jgi:hypothetical protein